MTMTSDAYYIQVLPDDAYNDVMSTPATPADKHPQLSESMDHQQRQRDAYQRLKPSRRLPVNDKQLVTSDELYDEIADIPPPPPPRPGRSICSVSVNSFIRLCGLWLTNMYPIRQSTCISLEADSQG